MYLALAKAVVGGVFTFAALLGGMPHCRMIVCSTNYIIADPETLAVGALAFLFLVWALSDIVRQLFYSALVADSPFSTPLGDPLKLNEFRMAYSYDRPILVDFSPTPKFIKSPPEKFPLQQHIDATSFHCGSDA